MITHSNQNYQSSVLAFYTQLFSLLFSILCNYNYYSL